MDTEQLIGELVADARPVGRVWSAGQRTLAVLGLALLVLLLSVWFEGPRPDLPELMRDGRFVTAELAALLTGILAIYACFRTALPDAPRGIGLLPLLPFALWVGMLGAGCFDELLRHPDRVHFETSFICMNTILLTSLPAALLMIVLLRRTIPFRPRPVAALAALGVSALASAALSLHHPLDSALLVVLWHLGTVALATAGAALFSRPLLRDERSEAV
jgi:hypothetical protein